MKNLIFRQFINHNELVDFINRHNFNKEDIQQILPYENGYLTLYYWEEIEEVPKNKNDDKEWMYAQREMNYSFDPSRHGR